MVQENCLAGAFEQTETHKVVFLSNYDLFNNAQSASDLNQDEVKKCREEINYIMAEGLEPVGYWPTWKFPAYVNPPLEPELEFYKSMDFKQLRFIATPPRNSVEYRRLLKERNEIITALAQEFSEIDTWLIGGEGRFLFVDLTGKRLTKDDLIPFMTDSIIEMGSTLRALNSDIEIIAHFLGRSGNPIVIGKEKIQPLDLINLIEKELEKRGDKQNAYFDFWSDVFDPTLITERKIPEPRYANLFEGQTRTSVGWNTLFSDGFNTGSSLNLVTHDSTWENMSTPSTLRTILEAGGKAYFQLREGEDCDQSDPENGCEKWIVAGANTESSVDVDPIGYFQYCGRDPFNDPDGTGSKECRRWTGVNDFNPDDEKADEDEGTHGGVFIRVNPMTIGGKDTCTRIGSYVYAGEKTNCDGTQDFCGAFQFTAVGNTSGDMVGKAIDFALDEQGSAVDIWGDPETLYRTQVIERLLYSNGFPVENQWKAQVWGGSLIGDSGWYSEQDIEALLPENLITPGLNGSRLLIGISEWDDASLEAEFSATAYWYYN